MSSASTPNYSADSEVAEGSRYWALRPSPAVNLCSARRGGLGAGQGTSSNCGAGCTNRRATFPKPDRADRKLSGVHAVPRRVHRSPRSLFEPTDKVFACPSIRQKRCATAQSGAPRARSRGQRAEIAAPRTTRPVGGFRGTVGPRSSAAQPFSCPFAFSMKAYKSVTEARFTSVAPDDARRPRPVPPEDAAAWAHGPRRHCTRIAMPFENEMPPATGSRHACCK